MRLPPVRFTARGSMVAVAVTAAALGGLVAVARWYGRLDDPRRFEVANLVMAGVVFVLLPTILVVGISWAVVATRRGHRDSPAPPQEL